MKFFKRDYLLEYGMFEWKHPYISFVIKTALLCIIALISYGCGK